MESSSVLSSTFGGYNAFLLALVALVLYNIGLVIYRLFFSPLARFPGPKITAITGWVEVYWDVVKGGQFIFQIEKWHEQYGPIIRITPWEVHIRDAEFYDELYSAKSRFSKMPHLMHRFNIPLSTFDVVEHDHHHRRRAIVAPFFTRQKVIDFSPYVTTRIEKLCKILETQYKGTGKVVILNEAWGALVTDALTWYTSALSYDFLDYPGFQAPFTTAIRNLAYSIPVSTHFPWFVAIMKALPESLIAVLDPQMKAVFDFHNELRKQIRRIGSGDNDGNKMVKHRTVFHELLGSNLQKGELTEDLLHNEAASITAAGIDTTKSALSVASFWIIKKREVYERLHNELVEAIPDSSQMPPLTDLEKLTYLQAVVQESALRLSYGVTERLMRTNPAGVIRYGKYTIPPNTRFSMTSYLQLRSPEIFPDPEEFIPERWLNNPVSPSGHPLNRYLSVFGKGPRMCLGMNFAQAEMYLALAGVFRRLDFELYQTDRSDVDMAGSYFVPMPKDGSQGVRVLVK
ncbi:cytochrome protein [Lojkania enalia]|uniref:Cytochrome protein n=1 Tax=Lojkania enalia TaxID=147567 RepID=A0A9P4K0M4_9PLEO|nr:cytochrome protein [Didymosphaeria enalia]